MAKVQGQSLQKTNRRYPGMENIIDEIITRFEYLDLNHVSVVRTFIDKLQERIEYHESRIPEEIDDDWFNQPANIPLSYKLKFLRRIKKNLLKILREAEDDSQNPEAVGSSDIDTISESDSYNPDNL